VVPAALPHSVGTVKAVPVDRETLNSPLQLSYSAMSVLPSLLKSARTACASEWPLSQVTGFPNPLGPASATLAVAVPVVA
jgi:hypothetical protein